MSKAISARTRSRELLVQALYQMQIAGHDVRELRRQFRERPEYQKVDQKYFDAVLDSVCADVPSLEQALGEFADRPIGQLDPVEKAILFIGYHELREVMDFPYRVVINEAVNLAKRFGAEDGHKYINALLDRASAQLRPVEHS